METLVGREKVVPESTGNLDPVENTASCDSIVKKVNWGFGEWEYLVSMYAAVAVVVVVTVDWVFEPVLAGFATGVEVSDKAKSAMG